MTRCRFRVSQKGTPSFVSNCRVNATALPLPHPNRSRDMVRLSQAGLLLSLQADSIRFGPSSRHYTWSVPYKQETSTPFTR
jgi:hypothetical protein